ncbi:hypothetical protein ASPBRDRAFT_464885 [Aspergillus brasiliensis CBS 101740]|uniref:Uncharacterized protein n=1 Tax=Aspergillus brasiliensis (strain CBS 101740 / IMI 381727 / IBT 21946) TaxID=767769 RepID=A0A1L9UTG5_ASPBC|nr:hypothetical protein ASPBRDRAFT_464885 [Aspergillus brasiliensis CBS 101740]
MSSVTDLYNRLGPAITFRDPHTSSRFLLLLRVIAAGRCGPAVTIFSFLPFVLSIPSLSLSYTSLGLYVPPLSYAPPVLSASATPRSRRSSSVHDHRELNPAADSLANF